MGSGTAPADVDVAVVGAGISGLAAAARLSAGGLTVAVFEARDRVGGRTLTRSGGASGGFFDLGASWTWPAQPELIALAERLGLEVFSQHESGYALYDHAAHSPPRTFEAPPMGSLRLRGGCQQLSECLAERLPAGAVLLEHRVEAIEVTGDAVHVHGVTGARTVTVTARSAVVAMPPRLAARLLFAPALPSELLGVMRATPTWMAQTLKVAIGFERPFWREDGLSGFALSHVGPLRELHDAVAGPDGTAALLGMALAAAPALRLLDVRGRRAAILMQLTRMLGPQADSPCFLIEHDWALDPFTAAGATDADGDPAATYGNPCFGQPTLDGRVVFAGAETSPVGAGQMHGALLAGLRAAALVAADG